MKALSARIVGIITLAVLATPVRGQPTLRLEPLSQVAVEYANVEVIVGGLGQSSIPLTELEIGLQYDPRMVTWVAIAYGNYLDLGILGSDKGNCCDPDAAGRVQVHEVSQESWTDLLNAQPSSFTVATLTFKQ